MNTQTNNTTKVYRQYKVTVDGQVITPNGEYLTLDVAGVKRLEAKGYRLFLVPTIKEAGLLG
jgi:hypothetical protein